LGDTIELHLDAKDGYLIGTLPVTSTSDAETWKSLSTSVDRASGIHDLFFVFKGKAGSKLFNFDNWQFQR
jgi:arabinoxylan arabinofuranohydrolase